MAEKRMLSKAFINNARFMKMSDSAKLLYVYLNTNADDDGIVEVFPFSQMLHTPEDDVKILQAKEFIYFLNDDWLAFLPHWLQNQYIRNDRYRASIYHNQLLNLRPDFKEKIPNAPLKSILDKNQTEELREDLYLKWYFETGIPPANQGTTQSSLVESSLNQSSLIENSVDKISQVPGGTHLFENIFNAESIQIIKTSTDRFTTSQTDKFIYLIVEMKDLTEKELKLKIDGQYYFEKTNQMLKKLFSGMNQKLNKGEELNEMAYINTTARNYWKEIANHELKNRTHLHNHLTKKR